MTRSNRVMWLVAIVVAFGMFVYPGYAFTSDGERKPVVAAAPGQTTTTVSVATTSTTPTTTTPTTTPATTTTTVAVEEPAPDPCAAEIAKEVTVMVASGCMIAGDVRGSRDQARASTTGAFAYFDGKGTHSVTAMSEPGWIYAPHGATVSSKSFDELCGDGPCLRNTWPQAPDYPDPEVPARKANSAPARVPSASQPAPANQPATSPQATEPPAEQGFIDTCWDQFKEIPQGSTVRIPAGCNLDAGDPHIDGYKFHDSRSSTCQVTVMQRAGNVTATYSPIGVSSRSPADLATADGKNCEIKNWPTDKGSGDFENQTDEVPSNNSGGFIDTCWDQFKEIPQGSTVRIPAGCNLDAGDPHIDGYKFHDSRSSTCQVTVMQRAGNVTATYSPIGVSSRSPADLATADGKNCEIKNWPTDKGSGDFENQTD